MRNILKLFAVFVLSFTVTNWAIAGFPPVRIGGLLQALKTKFTLLFPNNSVVMKGGVKAYVDTGNKSHLYDGDFEGDSVATEWSVTNATATLVDTERVNGKQHLNLAVAAAIPSINQDQNITVGGSFVASCWIKTDQIDVQFCSRIDGADSVCQNVSADDKWFKYSHQNFTSDTSTSFGVSIKGLSSITGNIKVDNCELEFGDQTQNIAQSEIYGQLEWPGDTGCHWNIAKTNTSFTNMPIDAQCSNPTIIQGSVTNDGDKSLHFIMPAGAPAGNYSIDFAMPINETFSSGNVACRYRLKSNNIESNTVDFYVSGSDNFATGANFSFKLDQPLASDEKIYFQARANSSSGGNCGVRSDLPEQRNRITIKYFPPQSQIVRQNRDNWGRVSRRRRGGNSRRQKI